MTDDGDERSPGEASRGDYPSMVRRARALYDDGLEPREVLRRCYGVDFPEEVFVIADDDPLDLDLGGDFTNQPWNLAVPPSRGGPVPEPDSLDKTERRIFALDPDLVPLMRLLDADADHGGSIVCYRLSELEAGRSTIFGIWWRVEPGDQARRYGDSLLSVLHEYHADIHRRLAARLDELSNRGAGSVDAEEVDEAWTAVEQVEELQRAVAARSGGPAPPGARPA